MTMYIGEALSGDGNEIAHIDLLIGPKDGPVGSAFANAMKGEPKIETILAKKDTAKHPFSPK